MSRADFLAEAAIEQGLLSTLQLDAIRQNLEASLPELRACRQLLIVLNGITGGAGPHRGLAPR